MQNVIEFEKVAKVFKQGKQTVHALKSLDFALQPGQVIGLVGPDGAGKTTLLRLMVGLLSPTKGVIKIFGQDIRHDHSYRPYMGYMPQRFGLYEELTIKENLNLYADLYGISQQERGAQFQRLLQFSRLEPFTNRQAGKLSGGMKQKLALACSLLVKPKILLLDEPSVGVDPLSRRELWELVQQLIRNTDTLVIWSTAYLDEAERCDHVLLLHEGVLLNQGKPSELSNQLAGRINLLLPVEKNLKRMLQRRLNNHPKIISAVIQGEYIRVLAEAEGIIEQVLKETQLNPSIKTIIPAPPRFEDSYMDHLFRLQSHKKPSYKTEHPDVQEDASLLPHQVGKRVDIEVRNLSKRFGDFWAVRQISFDVHQGEIFGLLGPNGAGKSTTFRMLCGLLAPTDGSAKVAGLDLGHSPAEARSRLGYMSQKFSLYGELSVKENIEFFGKVYGLQGKFLKNAYDKALEQFDLKAYERMPSILLPLGFKQRLALACALIHSPSILFLDEPTSGVDPNTRRQFWQEIGILADQGVTVLVTTHFMEEAEYCDRLGIIYRGQMIANGSPDDLKGKTGQGPNKIVTLEDTFIRLIQQTDQQQGPIV